jgi:hypothetical protein
MLKIISNNFPRQAPEEFHKEKPELWNEDLTLAEKEEERMLSEFMQSFKRGWITLTEDRHSDTNKINQK